MTEAKPRGPRGIARKTLDFFSIFTRSKRGILGISILVFFSVFAFVGPLLAPYDPVRCQGTCVAAPVVPPAWYSYFTPGLSQNLVAIPDSQFNDPSSVGNWKTNTSLIVLEHASDVGQFSPKGSLKLTYTRDASSPPATAVAFSAYTNFTYPYDGPAKSFIGNIVVRVTGVSSQNPVTVKVFLEEVGRIKYNLTSPQSQGLRFSTNSTPDSWSRPSTSIVSDSSAFQRQVLGFQPDSFNAAEKVFRKTANYGIGVEVLVKDVSAGPRNVEIFIDNFSLQLYGTSWGLLGTNFASLDLFSQLSFGARVSLLVGLLAAFISIGIGLFAGLMAGYLGKFADELIMRFTDMLLVLPGLPLLLVIIAVLGPNIWNIILLIGLLGWMGFARTVRSQVLSIRERPFIEASRAVGAGTFHITLRHVFPNIIGLTYVSLALAVPGAIIAEAALSWLGLGDPIVPSWGKILYDWQNSGGATNALNTLYWVIPPGICIAAVALSFVLIGYALDEVLNPKLRMRR